MSVPASLPTAGPAERTLRTVLRVLALVFIVAMGLYELGGLLPRTAGFVRHLPFVSNSVVKVAVLAFCCLYAAADLRGRFGLVWILLAAHAVSVIAMLGFLVAVDTGTPVDPGFGREVPLATVLGGAIVLDGVILVGLGILAWLAWREIRPHLPPPIRGPEWLTPQELWLRHSLFVLGAILVVSAFGYEAGPILGLSPDLFRELPFVSNSVVKVSALAMLCIYAALRLSQRLSLVGPIITAHAISGLAQIGFFLCARREQLDATFDVLGRTVSMREILWSSVGLDAAIAGVLAALYFPAWAARLRNRYFQPVEYRTLIALTEIMLVGEDERLTPEQAAANVDRALAVMRTPRRMIFRLGMIAIHYWPLASLYAPLPDLDPVLRAEYVAKRFYRSVGRTRRWNLLSGVYQQFTRLAHQLSALGYYSDRRVHRSIGYRVFSQRDYFPRPAPPRERHPLDVLHPWDLAGDTITADVCIVGSGAGGGILAYELARRGREVLVLERGRYVEPRHFVEDDLRQMEVLYDGGILNLSDDSRFSVLQGNCVGGSTTINNGICFDPPPPVLARWNGPEMDAGVDADALGASVLAVRQALQVGSIATVRHHRAAQKLARAPLVSGGELFAPLAFEANIRTGPSSCHGCGYCNIGCAYGNKLSMLDTMLPWAQQRFDGRLRILAECDVRRMRTLTGRPKRALDLQATLSDGREVRVQARTFVLAAGAIGSSEILLRSGLGRELPVGRHLSFNMITPVFADFAEPQGSFDGIQMGHFVGHRQDEFILETWFSPPVGLATAMPGWFEDHYRNMRRAGHMTGYGVVVGTERNAQLRRGLDGDYRLHFQPRPSDMRRLAHGVTQLARVLFDAGASRVLLNTWDDGSFKPGADLGDITRAVTDPRFVTVASAHPMGGNAMSRQRALGVVDRDFRVHGFENLYVCDASVIPSSLQVNPQLTVMALAHYAANHIR
jgi:choline dehydrogenase-like flavoprotein